MLNFAQNTDGGWAYISPSIGGTPIRGPSRLIPTARATLSTSRWAVQFGVNGYITSAINWLTAQQLADGGFNDDPNAGTGSAYETGLVLQAIRQAQAVGNAAANAASSIVIAAEDFLVSAQQSNGSWNNDPMIVSTVISGLPVTTLIDQDSDGIPDEVEVFTGTNPSIADARTLLQPIGNGEVGTHSAELIVATEFGEAINTFLPVSTGALSFFINAGVLPEGLTLNENTGQITGTPTSAGSFNIEYGATFADGRRETRVAAITVASPQAVQIPIAPGYMLALMAVFFIIINRFMRRSIVSTTAFMLVGVMAQPDSLMAAEKIPPAVSERIINEYSGGRKAFQDADINALEADIAQSLKAAKSVKARRMFGRSLVPTLTQYQALVEKRLQAMEKRLRKLGNVQAAEKMNARRQALANKIGSLQDQLEALDGNMPVKGDTAIAHMQRQIAQTRAMYHPDHPVPTWRQDEPGPALELPGSKGIPAYLSADYHNRAGQMFAFNGNVLLLAAAPQTPTEAASCSYTAADLADDGKDITLTQSIHDLAKSLDYSPTRIFEYVANNISFEPYYGALKGAQNTLETKGGSATDQASLLIALLRASNIPARYVRAVVQFQDASIAETESVVNRWLQTKSYAASSSRLASGGNPTALSITNGSTEVGLRFSHVWVEACVPYAHYRGASLDNAGHRWIPLDPSFETRRYETGITSAESFDFDAYLSGFNSTLPHEVFEEQVRQTLTGSNSLVDVGYQSDKIAFELDILPASLPYHIFSFTDWSNSGTPETSELPDSHRYFLHVDTKNAADQALGASISQHLSALLIQPLTLSFEGSSPVDQAVLDDWRINGGLLPTGINLTPVLRIDGAVVATGSASVSSETTNNNLTMSVSLAEARASLAGACTVEPNTQMITAVCFDGISAANYYALQAYAFQTSRSVLEELADKVVENVNAAAQLNDDLDGTLGRFLHFAALKYMGEISTASKRIGQLKGNTGDSGLHLGLTSTQSYVEKFLDLPFGINKQGFLIDVPGGQSRSINLMTGAIDFESFVLSGYAASAQESAIWRETARLDAVSTITGLQHANETGSTVLTINAANQGTELPKIKTVSSNPGNPLAYADSFISNIVQGQYLNNGFEIKVPDQQINFKGWEGYVLVATKGDSNSATASFPISGGFAGAYSVPDPTPIITYNPSTDTGYVGGTTSTAGSGSGTDTQAIAQVNYGTVGNGGGSANPNNTFAGDPVNLVTGNFYHTERDLVIANRDLPFVFERAYNSRAAVDGPLGFGWTHSFNHQLRFLDEKADGVADGFDSDNLTSSLVWLDGSGGEKRISVSGTTGGVAIGAAMPAPAGARFTLTRDADGRYRLLEKSGLIYTFANTAGQVGTIARLEQITSRNGNRLILHYTGNDLTSVSDDNNRAITFSYSQGNGRITGLSDWTGRSHRYVYDGAGNLTAYHNPKALAGDQSPTQYRYYSASDSPNIDHAIKQIILPKGNSLRFEYYADGRVFRHTNSAGEQFSFFYNDFRRETQVTDARGFVTRTFFNEYGNPVDVIDATQAVTAYEYNDPQDPYHRTAVINALKHRTEYQYDANSNITRITLPSGNTVQYSHYTAFGQPGKIKDANGNYTLHQYDAQGNLRESIVLKSGLGTNIDPVGYQPAQHPNDILAWTRHSYDSAGNKQSIEQIRDIANARGFKRHWSYDAHQLYATRLQRCGDKDGDGDVLDDACDSAPLVFDSLGRMTNGVNTRFEAIEIHYNSLNQIIRATDAVGQRRDYGYDDNGNPDYEGLLITLNGIPTLVDAESADFDDSDRQRLALDAGGYATRFDYDRMGNLTALTNPDNYPVHFSHDPLGRVLSAYDQEGREARRKLDALGRMQSLTDPNGNRQTFHYYDADQDARLHQQCDALNRCSSFDYDNNGNVIQLTDPVGNSTLSDYDALNRPVRVVGPVYNDPTYGNVRPVSHYHYDPLGNLIEIRAGHTDASGILSALDQVTIQQSNNYDDWGRLLSQRDPLHQVTHYQYNVHSDITRIEDPKGQIIERDYRFGGLIQEQRSYLSAADGDPHVIRYTRNALGQPTRIDAPEISYRYRYDQAHRLHHVIDSRGVSLSYDWSPGGLLDTLSDGQGNDTDYLYDPTGRLTHIFAPDGETLGYHYDDGGRLIQQDLPGNITRQYSYNPDDSLSHINIRNSNGTLFDQQIGYDGLGRKHTETTTLNGQTHNKSYSYDSLSRLLSETHNGQTTSWRYDRYNNRSTQTQGGISRHYHHNGAQQLTHITENSPSGTTTDQFLYDANGNLTKHCQNNIATPGHPAADCSGSTELILHYDALDRQSQAEKTGIPSETYHYDPYGRRIQKNSGTQTSQYHYDGDSIYQQAQHTPNTPADWHNPSARYVHGAGTDTPQLYYGPTQTQVYHQDAQHSVIATTDENGTLSGAQGYDAWGNPQTGQTSGQPMPT